MKIDCFIEYGIQRRSILSSRQFQVSPVPDSGTESDRLAGYFAVILLFYFCFLVYGHIYISGRSKRTRNTALMTSEYNNCTGKYLRDIRTLSY